MRRILEDRGVIMNQNHQRQVVINLNYCPFFTLLPGGNGKRFEDWSVILNQKGLISHFMVS